MKLLLENWREYLNEKKWEDYEVSKNTWFNIPLEDIRAAAQEAGGEVTIADELYHLIDTAYKNIGGHFKFSSARDLPSKYTDWLAVDVDGDSDPDALRAGTGKKMAVGGHDGTREAVNAYISKTAELFKTSGFYGEISKALSHIMITRHQVPFVNNQKDVEKVLGKKVNWIGEHPQGKYPGYNGWYCREFSGVVCTEMKILVGIPIGIKGTTQP